MTDTTWAAKVLESVPRLDYSSDVDLGHLQPKEDGSFIPYDDALAAIAKLAEGDGLVERWDDYVESMGSVMGEVEHMAQQMRDRIAALTAERDRQYDENVHRIAEQAKAEAEAAALRAKVARLEGALTEIAEEASVPVHTWKNGINFKKMYEGWRKIAAQRIDTARAALTDGAADE